ncbi:MAG TPA: dienelactone hydrolase [Acidobacteriota bacterium]|nr:dienelactone hydrolase [Acidobacteriota bacterium]
MTRDNRRCVWGLQLPALLFLCSPVMAAAPTYDPLAISNNVSVLTVDLTVHDAARKRDIPIRVYLPPEKTAAPVLIFSHGLGGSREGNAFMGFHWAGRGYLSVFIQHPGSDTGVWQDKPAGQRMEAMRRAASLENFMLRVKDVPAVLDQLELWNKTDGHVLAGRMDLKRVGMSGHSFGAVTTQAVSGQTAVAGMITFTDARIKAAIAFSPSSPRAGDPKQAFGKVKIPWMLMTGTQDVAVIGDATLESRMAVFPALPPGGKYELVLYNAEHSAFTDRALPGDKIPRNPNHHRAILALSTAFWDAYLKGDQAARDWLDGNGPNSVIEKQDRWQKK